MKTKNSQETQRLLDSVKENYNQSDELDRRKKEVEYGLAKSEQPFVEEFPAGSCLLDIGCASGRLCLALAQQGYTVTGIDVAEKQIAQAKQIAAEKDIDVTFLHYEPPTLPFPDASFTAAFMGNVYCYIPHSAARIAFLKEVARVLYPDGQLLLFQSILDAIFDNYKPITMITTINLLRTIRHWRKAIISVREHRPTCTTFLQRISKPSLMSLRFNSSIRLRKEIQ